MERDEALRRLYETSEALPSGEARVVIDGLIKALRDDILPPDEAVQYGQAYATTLNTEKDPS